MLLVPGGGNKILGGCATVAGWGNRYSTDDMHDNQASCMTDYSNLSPDKIGFVGWREVVFDVLILDIFRFCVPKFKVGGKIIKGCTKDELKPADMTRPCSLFSRELDFIKQMDSKKGKSSSKSKYMLMDLDEMAKNNESPVEISIKVKAK